MKFIRRTLPYLVASLIASLSLFFSMSAMAQYVWLDASGRKVFSDQPPPASIPSKRILQQPNKSATSMPASIADEKPNPEADADGAKNAAKPKTAAQPNASKDKDLEAAKKKLDDEAAAKKKEEQDVREKAMADNCARAKQAKTSLASGVRLNQYNDKGERVFMDEAARMVEAKRIDGIIATDCK